ncbi:MAG: hypothetical protein M3R15_10965 [Acidobacteriota bacterium]|nr:hypothetical protein [Acidobacteriota bacterium]
MKSDSMHIQHRMRYAKIINTGSYVPERVQTDDDLRRMLGENPNDFYAQQGYMVECPNEHHTESI